MERDGAGQRSEEEQEVKEGGNDGCQKAARAECLLEDVGQRNEGEAGANAYVAGIHADVEDGWEDDEA